MNESENIAIIVLEKDYLDTIAKDYVLCEPFKCHKCERICNYESYIIPRISHLIPIIKTKVCGCVECLRKSIPYLLLE